MARFFERKHKRQNGIRTYLYGYTYYVLLIREYLLRYSHSGVPVKNRVSGFVPKIQIIRTIGKSF